MKDKNIDSSTTQNNESEDNSTKKQHIFTPNRQYFTISVYAIAVVCICILIYKVLGDFSITGQTIHFILGIVSPFIIGAFIAFLLSPLARWAQNVLFTKWIKIKPKRVKKYFSLIFTYVVAIGLIAIIIRYVGPQIYESASELVSNLPEWYRSLMKSVSDLLESHPEWHIDTGSIMEKLNEFMPKIVDYSSNLLQTFVPAVFVTVTSIVKGFFNFIIAFMVSIYMLSEHNDLRFSTKRIVYAILPKAKADKLVEVSQQSIKIFGGFLFGKTIDSLIIGALCFIFMSIFRFPYPLLISVIVGVTNMIPYFGPFIGGGIGGVIIIIVEPVQVIFFGLLILALQQFDGLYLGPKILGDSTGLRPIWVIFSITVGGSLFGVLGMFLGVPCVAVIRYLLDMFVNYRLNSKNIELVNTEEEAANKL